MEYVESIFLSLSSWSKTTDEGEYTCEVCTVFGLDKEEVKTLCGAGLKFTDQNKDAEGYEVKTSAFKARTKVKDLMCHDGMCSCCQVSIIIHTKFRSCERWDGTWDTSR